MTAATAIGMRNPGDDVAASRASGCGGSQKQDMITLNVSARQCQKRSGSILGTRRSQVEYSLEQYADNGNHPPPRALSGFSTAPLDIDPNRPRSIKGLAQIHRARGPYAARATTAALNGITGKDRINCP